MREEFDARTKFRQGISTPLPVGFALFAMRSKGEGIDGKDGRRNVECSTVDRLDLSPFRDQTRIGPQSFGIASHCLTDSQLSPET